MSDSSVEEKLISIKGATDFSVVGDNILDIADFTVEKHEFRTDSALPPEVREEAVARIKDVLWQRIEEMKRRRHKLLEELFQAAQATLDEVVGKD